MEPFTAGRLPRPAPALQTRLGGSADPAGCSATEPRVSNAHYWVYVSYYENQQQCLSLMPHLNWRDFRPVSVIELSNCDYLPFAAFCENLISLQDSLSRFSLQSSLTRTAIYLASPEWRPPELCSSNLKFFHKCETEELQMTARLLAGMTKLAPFFFLPRLHGCYRVEREKWAGRSPLHWATVCTGRTDKRASHSADRSPSHCLTTSS